MFSMASTRGPDSYTLGLVSIVLLEVRSLGSITFSWDAQLTNVLDRLHDTTL